MNKRRILQRKIPKNSNAKGQSLYIAGRKPSIFEYAASDKRNVLLSRHMQLYMAEKTLQGFIPSDD